jgi:hypothetical protein
MRRRGIPRGETPGPLGQRDRSRGCKSTILGRAWCSRGSTRQRGASGRTDQAAGPGPGKYCRRRRATWPRDLERPELPLRDCAVPSSNSSVTPLMVVSDPEGAVSFLHDVFDGVGEVEGGLR